MPDSSPLVPWVTALLGCAVSYGLARLHSRETTAISVLLAGAKAFGLSLASVFACSMMHGVCIDVLHRCTAHGDANIQYAFGGVLAFPLFWLIIAVFGKAAEVEPVQSISAQCKAACSVALIRRFEGKPDSTPCPACKQVIATERREPQGAEAHVVTRCSCGKCNKRLPVRPSPA